MKKIYLIPALLLICNMCYASNPTSPGPSGATGFYNAGNGIWSWLTAGVFQGVYGHVQQAFQAADELYFITQGMQIDPRYYGASCNSQYADDRSPNLGYVTTTAGSPNILIAGYTCNPAIASAGADGDVGKAISVWDYTGAGPPATYISGCTTTSTLNDTIVLGANMASNSTTSYAVFGGAPAYPSVRPQDAVDDTAAIHNASGSSAIYHGGVVVLPPQCLVHNLNIYGGTRLQGNNGGNFYGYGDNNRSPTWLNVLSNGFGNDAQLGIDVNGGGNVAFSNFSLRCNTFPYMGFPGITLAGIGTNGAAAAGNETVLLDHVGVYFCPVGFGSPFGRNFPVTFTATISGTTMTVSAITSNNFSVANGALTSADYLAKGRTFTGAGVTETIVDGPGAGGAGTYTVSIGTTVASPTAMSSPNNGMVIFGSSRFNQFSANGLGMSGDFSDWQSTKDTFTDDFSAGIYIGPVTSASGASAGDFSLGRVEESGAGFVCNGCYEMSITEYQMQFNGGYAYLTQGSWGHINITGGFIQGNGAGNTGASHQAQIGLNGTGGDGGLTLHNVDINKFNIFGSAPNYIFDMLSTGAGNNHIEIEGGPRIDLGYATAIYNAAFAASMPPCYRQRAMSIPIIDTCNSTLSIGTSGQVAIGSSTATAGAVLDLGSNANSMLLPVGTTGQRPSGVAGMLRYNSTIVGLEAYYGSQWNSLGTSNGLITLGTSVSVANPSISGDVTSGFYTPSASKVAVTAGGVEVEQWNTAATGVNYLSVTPSATGSGPSLASAGSDTNIVLNLASKGTSAIAFLTGSTQQMAISSTASAVNYPTFTGSVTTGPVYLGASGTDTNISMVLTPKGTGNVYTLSGVAIGSSAQTAGTILDMSGTANASLAAILPIGTTGQRPGSPVEGMMRYNSTTHTPEFWNGSAWTAF